MQRTPLFLAVLLTPALAFALDYSRSANQYNDASVFSAAESAAISVLTNLDAVGGYPDGTFQPDTTVNRAEFLKIVFLGNPHVVATEDDADDCFPDVRSADWFSRYVCLAKRRGDVAGYPDGFFRPANTVNYAEALKMLGELYDLDLPEPPSNERWAWYTAYLRAAEEHDVDLSGVDPAAELTRGQMVRLAAAYRAENDGELEMYRDFERGETPRSSRSSRSSSSSSTSQTSSTSSVSSTSSTSQTSSATARSTFMIVGRTTGLLADAIFVNESEDTIVRSAFVELEDAVDSIDKLFLTNAAGTVIAELNKRGTSSENEVKWEGNVTQSGGYRITKGTQARLGLKARLLPVTSGGGSNELFEIDTWRVRLEGADSATFAEPGLIDAHLPRHQTVLGKFTDIKNVLASSITITPGLNKLVGTFAFDGEIGTGATLQVSEVNFVLEQTGVSVSNIRIGSSSPVQQQGCGVEQGTGIISCGAIPDGLGVFAGTAPQLSLYADVALNLNQTSGTFRLVPNGRGAIGSFGALRWSDGVGTFTWIEADGALEAGPLVTVTN